MKEQGYFIFSLDTELATGQFDRDAARHRLFSGDGSAERAAISRLIDIFEEFNIVGTWTLVGHLFYAGCEECTVCPMKDWRGKYTSFEEVYQTRHPLWYGADIVDVLLARGIQQEIGFHGYSHRVFDEGVMSASEAKLEVEEWLRVGNRKGVAPRSAVFPRNRIGHLDVLREAGITCYRSEAQTSPLFNIKYIGKFIKTMDKLLGLSDVPVFDLICSESHGLVKLPPSEYFFDINRKFELFLDSLHLHTLRMGRIVDGIQRAAREKKMIHLWAHPCEFRTEKDFAKLRQVFLAVSEEVKQGRMRSVSMAEMSNLLKENAA